MVKQTAKKNNSEDLIKPVFESIYHAVEARVRDAKFTNNFMATQITIDERDPLYVRVEDGCAEVAPYEYNNASFYIDSQATDMADVLNGKKDIYKAIAEGSVRVNGDAALAIIFVKTVF